MFQKIKSNNYFIPFVFIITCILIVNFQVVFGGKTLTTGIVSEGVMGTNKSVNFNIAEEKEVFNIIDRGGSAWQDEPLTVKVANTYKKFLLPVWNKNMGFGRPLAADMMSLAYSPFRIFSFISDSSAVLDFSLLLRVVVGSIFMFVFLDNLKFSKYSSAIGSVIYSLSGYFIYYSNMGHLYVELMLPLLLFSVDKLVTRISKKHFLFLLLSILLMMLGGHPESMMIAFVVSLLYFLFRLLQLRKNKKNENQIKKTLLFFLSYIFVLGLLGFLIVPFLEFYFNSDVGIHNSIYKLFDQALPFNIFVFQFFPILMQSSLKSLNNNYWPSIVLFLVIVSFFSKKHRGTMLFFVSLLLILVLKVYSNLFFGWLQYVPIFNNFVYYKYLQPEISFSLAVLSCIGLDYLRYSRKILTPFVLGLTILIVSFLYVYINLSNYNYSFGPRHLFGAIIIPLLLLLFYYFIKIVFSRIRCLKKIEISFIFLCLVTVYELLIFSPKDKPLRGIPYSEPSYVNFLKREKDPFRVYSTDQILYPATASVFDIDDVRDLHAVYPRLYTLYVRSFIDNSVLDRFSEYNEKTDIYNNKLFDLMNAKFVLSNRPLDVDHENSIFMEIIDQNKLDSNSALTFYNINHDVKSVLFEHPPELLKYKFIPDIEKPILKFSIAMDPSVWDPRFGNGVWFLINVKKGGISEQLFKKYIDPKNNKNDRKWIDASIDLSKYIGKSIVLEFITSTTGSNSFGWCGWGDLRLVSSVNSNKEVEAQATQFLNVYNDEILIYENSHSLPRSFLVHNVVLVDSEEEAVNKMKSKSFDPRYTAIIINNSDGRVTTNMERTNRVYDSDLSNEDEVIFVSQTDTKLAINALITRPSYLVVSNLYYPGWKVFVDDNEHEIYQTNLSFSGVFLQEGNHKIVFKYDPISYKLGIILSVFSLSALIIFIYKFRIYGKSKK